MDLNEQAIRSNALRLLTEDQQKRLRVHAEFRANGSPFEPTDLLQAAFARWLSSKVPVTTAEDTYKYLCGAMRNTASNERRRAATERGIFGARAFALDGRQDPMEAAPDPAGSQEDGLLLSELYGLFAEDPDVQNLLILQGAERAEILEELGWNVTKYETVQKRKKRGMARLLKEGRI